MFHNTTHFKYNAYNLHTIQKVWYIVLLIIGIAMVVLPYIGTMRKHYLNFSFYFQIPLNLTSTNIKAENMLTADDIWRKKSRKVCKTGERLVFSTSTESACSSYSSPG